MTNTGRAKFKKYKVAINLLVKFFSFFGRKLNFLLLSFFRDTGGVIGILLRYIFLKNCCEHLGDNVSIKAGVYLLNCKKLRIGNNVSIHPMCYIDAAGGVSIENEVSIAHNCSILSANHQWSDLDTPIKYNKEALASVVIKNDVWVGCGVRILAGVVVESRSVIAAGAVVNKNIEGNSVYGGVPANKIKNI